MRKAVVKLGGSTADQPELRIWIAALAASTLPLVVVPGGGAFADEVRSAQKRMGFSDSAAHAMAILAMDQFAHVILDRQDRLVPAHSLDDIETAFESGKIPVWLPSALAVAAPDIPVSWTVTSDSLAAWLAGKLGANELLLIKQTDTFSESDDIGTLMTKGIVDPAFSAMLPIGVDVSVAGPQHAGIAAAMLSSAKLPGTPIVPGEVALRRAG